jgi:hypothetical protein
MFESPAAPEFEQRTAVRRLRVAGINDAAQHRTANAPDGHTHASGQGFESQVDELARANEALRARFAIIAEPTPSCAKPRSVLRWRWTVRASRFGTAMSRPKASICPSNGRQCSAIRRRKPAPR